MKDIWEDIKNAKSWIDALDLLLNSDSDLGKSLSRIIKQDKEIEKLESDNKKMRDVLEFYGDRNNWTTFITQEAIFDGFVDGDFCDAFNSDHENNRQDSGLRARELLLELEINK